MSTATSNQINAHSHHCSVCGEEVEEFCADHPKALVDSIQVFDRLSEDATRRVIREERMDAAHVGPVSSLVVCFEDTPPTLGDDQFSEPAHLSSEEAFRAQVREWKRAIA